MLKLMTGLISDEASVAVVQPTVVQIEEDRIAIERRRLAFVITWILEPRRLHLERREGKRNEKESVD